jgi:hypothetical protein
MYFERSCAKLFVEKLIKEFGIFVAYPFWFSTVEKKEGTIIGYQYPDKPPFDHGIEIPCKDAVRREEFFFIKILGGLSDYLLRQKLTEEYEKKANGFFC